MDVFLRICGVILVIIGIGILILGFLGTSVAYITIGLFAMIAGIVFVANPNLILRKS